MHVNRERSDAVDANTYSLKQILTQDRRYVVPTFQRDYEWTRDGQWELLFTDLEDTSDRLHQARCHAESLGEPLAKADKKVQPHFLGAIVCDQLSAPAGGLDLRAVIDGQQRLTTIQLVLRGVLDVLIERGSARVKQVRRLLENHPDVVELPEERYKLWPRRRDRDVWPHAMDDAPPPPSVHHGYLKAREYFAERARAATVGVDGSDRTDVLVDALLDLFKLVVIDLEDNDDAQVIFEVLNGRQTPLSAADLVKNLLFLRGELSDEKELELVYDTYWAPFDDTWWKVAVGRGHAQRGRRDVLLSSWLTAVSTTETNVGHLYSEVRHYLDDAQRKTVDVLAELRDFGKAYRVVVGAENAETAQLRRSYRRIDSLGFTTALPLLLWLRTRPAQLVPVSDQERAVRAIESWLIRRFLLGANTRGYGKVFVDILKSAAERTTIPGVSVADAVIGALRGNPDQLSWPTDQELVTAFTTRKAYGGMTQERIRLVLSAIDEHLQNANLKTEPATFDYDKLQIEHVMPQAWRDHWPLESTDAADRQLEAQQRDQAVHRFGNLTLVTSTFNQSVSNLAWSVKKPEFAEQSSLQLNRSIGMCPMWSVEDIQARAVVLAELAAQVWPD
ncbi:hypothetical protein KUTG_02367 [Kutzneria sp. 744]|nr:hypothetical protein KUTG_02367 [Kutzneria sp. 744]